MTDVAEIHILSLFTIMYLKSSLLVITVASLQLSAALGVL
jgi:hypothetical protein